MKKQIVYQKPINMPTEEEIINKSLYANPIKMGNDISIPYNSFIEGAKWMKDEIINRNK